MSQSTAMSPFARVLGVVRSLAIYHLIPRRQRRMRRLYAGFVRPGDLVFDIGAHAGNRARGFAALGCQVVAIEPQPDFARLLQVIFAGSRQIVVVRAAVGAAPGPATLAISERTPTVTTLSATWREARAKDPEFARVRWNHYIEVDTVTLDTLIDRFGTPAFVKIDAEGSEAAILAGLSRPLPGLSFEYIPRALDDVEACVRQLKRLGLYRFNWSPGEAYQLALADWVTDRDLLVSLREPIAQRRPGDVYAQLAGALG